MFNGNGLAITWLTQHDSCLLQALSLFQAQNATLEAQANTELAMRIKNLEQEVARHKEDSGKAQAEVDRLLEILREMENEKNDKDKKISELERWVETMLSSLVFLQGIFTVIVVKRENRLYPSTSPLFLHRLQPVVIYRSIYVQYVSL